MSIPFTLSEQSLTFILAGEAITVDRSSPQFGPLVDEINKGDAADEAVIRRVVGGYLAMGEILFEDKTKAPNVQVTRRGVYYAGCPVSEGLANRMVDIHDAGLPLDPWAQFVERLMANPSPWAQEELYEWLEKSDLPITDDGHFLAYKKVLEDYKDIHTGTFDNSPGTDVVMPGGRPAVDDKREHTCSEGLHFCSRSYLKQFGTGSGDRVVLVKIDPADVVSIPVDDGRSKGRTWRYHVVQDITDTFKEGEINLPPVVMVDDADNIWTEYESDDYWEDDDLPWEEEYEEEYEDSPATSHGLSRGLWKKIWKGVTGKDAGSNQDQQA